MVNKQSTKRYPELSPPNDQAATVVFSIYTEISLAQMLWSNLSSLAFWDHSPFTTSQTTPFVPPASHQNIWKKNCNFQRRQITGNKPCIYLCTYRAQWGLYLFTQTSSKIHSIKLLSGCQRWCLPGISINLCCGVIQALQLLKGFCAKRLQWQTFRKILWVLTHLYPHPMARQHKSETKCQVL